MNWYVTENSNYPKYKQCSSCEVAGVQRIKYIHVICKSLFPHRPTSLFIEMIYSMANQTMTHQLYHLDEGSWSMVHSNSWWGHYKSIPAHDWGTFIHNPFHLMVGTLIHHPFQLMVGGPWFTIHYASRWLLWSTIYSSYSNCGLYPASIIHTSNYYLTFNTNCCFQLSCDVQ